MACPNCGCRMVSKAGGGRSKNRLICTDCGHPVDLTALAREQRRRWQAALVLGLLSLGGVLLFLLASLNEQGNGEGPGIETAPTAGEEQPAGEAR